MIVDLNADLGESFGRWELGDDAALLGIVTSANVACGFHAGDPGVIRGACERAAERGAAVGAQVSYRDLGGFGRRFIDMAPEDLTNDVLYQLGALAGFARIAGTEVSYVKPHGALYNAIVAHEQQAAAVVDAVRRFDPGLAVLGLPGSRWLDLAARAGLRTFREAFADRAYTPEGTLVPRRESGAVLEDPAVIADRCARLARADPIATVDGGEIAVEADSICVHGDSPGAVAVARQVRDRLSDEGMTVAPFAGVR